MLIAARTFLLTLQAFEFRSFLQPSTVTESIVHPSPEQIVRVKGQKLHHEHFIFKDLFQSASHHCTRILGKIRIQLAYLR